MNNNYSDNFFDVGSKFGFLPKNPPLVELPERYLGLQKLLDNMPVNLEDGSKGYLSIPNKIKVEVEELTNYFDIVKNETDIMANTKYAKATGGTPIISWIPNQIKSVLSYIEVILNELHSMNRNFNLEQNNIYTQSANTLQPKLKLLDKQLIIVSDSNYNPGKVFELNKKFKLEDTNIEKK